MNIDLKLVKKLRDFSGAGMLEVKKALIATKGDFDKAIIYLKEKGLSKAEKKMDRIAADGLVGIKSNKNKAIIMELNCETDFVALTDDFKKLFKSIISHILNNNINTLEEAIASKLDGKTIELIIKEATAIIGEKICLRRFVVVTKSDTQNFGDYIHSNGKIASLVIINNGTTEVAKNISMHLTAMNPKYITFSEISKEELEEYKSKILKEMVNVNKPDAIKNMIAEGKMKKILSQIVFVEQEFVMEAKKTISQYLKEHGATFHSAIRFEVGEGIEKNTSNFEEEVKSQMTK